MDPAVTDAVSTSLWSHLLTVGGFVLAFFAIARLMREKRQPGNTMAWLLGIVLIPYVGVPLYLLLGGRKIQRLVARKSRVEPRLPGTRASRPEVRQLPSVVSMMANGAGEPVAGNTLRLLRSGEEAFAEFAAQIRAARHSIHITTFILGRDETGRELVRLLAERARAGVKVRLLLDAVGCFFSSRGFTDPLREAGGEIVRFMPVAPLSTRSSANLRNHRKIAVFDQRTAIVGGHNLADDYMGPHPSRRRFADFGAVVHGPAAALLNEVFLADWSFARDVPLEALHQENDPAATEARGEVDLQVIASGPDVRGDPLYEGLLTLIHEAQQSIWIVTPYFIPDEVLQRSLLVKARAGKDVTIIVPARSNHPITDYARRHYLRELQAAGARVLLYTPGMLHSKAMIVDDRIGLLGSANFDLRSLFVNFEIAVAVYTEEAVADIRRWAGEVVRDCRELTPDPPRRFRLLGNVAEDLSRLLAPLL